MMTSRQCYKAVLTELNKVSSPHLLLEDFNYFINKSIDQYVNKKYNTYDVNQQSTDDLQALKAMTVLEAYRPWDDPSNPSYQTAKSAKDILGPYCEVKMPNDYMHILNCICLFEVRDNFKCHKVGDQWQCSANRLTSDQASVVVNNSYRKPSYLHPYYIIVNTNIDNDIPTDPIQEDNEENYIQGTDIQKAESIINDNGLTVTTITGELPRTITLRDRTSEEPVYTKVTSVDKVGTIRYGNPSKVIMQIRYGKETPFMLKKVAVDYIKVPQHVRLTQEQLDTVQDTSQIMEFSDNVCQQIINGLVTLIMENSQDQRVQNNQLVNQTIATPVAQQQPQ